MPRLGLHITDRCQLDCQHCLRDPGLKPRDMSVALVERVLDQAVAAYGVRDVSLTGGEPTLHPDFIALIDAIVMRGLRWDMVSNGKRLPQQLSVLQQQAPRLRGLRSITLSLDGATEPVHDSIREPGSYRDVLAAVTACVARDVPFGIQMAVNARNVTEIEQLGFLAAQLGAKHVSFAMTQPTGTVHDEALFLSVAAWKQVRARVERLAQVLSIQVVLPEGHYEESRFTTCGPFRGDTLHVNVEGQLTLCCLHSQVPSNSSDDVAADLKQVSLVAAHKKLLEIIFQAQLHKLERLNGEQDSGWSHLPCNQCLASFGKPYWTTAGAEGPRADRERWRGAWTPGAKRHALPSSDGDTRVRLPLVGPDLNK